MGYRFFFFFTFFRFNFPFFSAATDSFLNRFAIFSKSIVPTRTRWAADLFPLWTFPKSATTRWRREWSCCTVSVKAIENTPRYIHFLHNFFEIFSARTIQKYQFIFLLLIPTYISATLIGNPSNPSIQKQGIFQETPQWWSFRASYFGDYVYSQRFNDEFEIGGTVDSPTHLQFWTQAGMVTWNIKNRIDLYGIVGGMRLQIDEEVRTKQQFAWGVGGKIIFLHEGRFRAGCDFKYFQSNQSPSFFQSDNLAYNVVGNFHFDYSELQAALGLSYTTRYVSPYINGTYLIAKLDPKPPIATVRLPMVDMEVDVISKSVTAHHRFGFALGMTLIDHSKATIGIEWRAINQNSIDITGEIRF